MQHFCRPLRLYVAFGTTTPRNVKQRVSSIERGSDPEGIKGFLDQQIFIEDLVKGLEFADSERANVDGFNFFFVFCVIVYVR